MSAKVKPFLNKQRRSARLYRSAGGCFGSVLTMADDEERIPIEQVLPGFKIHPLDDGLTPVQAFVLIKSHDEAGDPTWGFRTSKAFNLEELLGALVVQTRYLEKSLVREWEEDEAEDRGDGEEPASDAGGATSANDVPESAP